MSDIRRSIPNAITMARLALALAFFVVLSVEIDGYSEVARGRVAIVLFIVAALSDVLDGYLARRWNAVSAFGRIMDPFVDKILVLGAFIMLVGEGLGRESGVRAWMVVVIVGREFLVTTIRAVLESRGVAFPADWSGKLKMYVQSVTIPFCILCATHEGLSSGWTESRDVLVWMTVAATILSATPYSIRAWQSSKGLGW